MSEKSDPTVFYSLDSDNTFYSTLVIPKIETTMRPFGIFRGVGVGYTPPWRQWMLQVSAEAVFNEDVIW